MTAPPMQLLRVPRRTDGRERSQIRFGDPLGQAPLHNHRSTLQGSWPRPCTDADVLNGSALSNRTLPLFPLCRNDLPGHRTASIWRVGQDPPSPALDHLISPRQHGCRGPFMDRSKEIPGGLTARNPLPTRCGRRSQRSDLMERKGPIRTGPPPLWSELVGGGCRGARRSGLNDRRRGRCN